MEQNRLLQDELKRLTTELQAYNAEQSAIWGDLDDRLLARYIAGECKEEERRLVESAADRFPAIRETIEIVSGAFADVETEPEAPARTVGGSGLERLVADPSDGIQEAASRDTITQRPQLYGNAPTRANPINSMPSVGKWTQNRWRAVAAAVFLVAAFAIVAELRKISSQRDEITRLTAARDEAVRQLAQIQQSGNSTILQGTGNAASSVDWSTLVDVLDLKNRPPEEGISLLKEHAEKRVTDRIQQLEQAKPAPTAAALLSELFKEFDRPEPGQGGQK